MCICGKMPPVSPGCTPRNLLGGQGGERSTSGLSQAPGSFSGSGGSHRAEPFRSIVSRSREDRTSPTLYWPMSPRLAQQAEEQVFILWGGATSMWKVVKGLEAPKGLSRRPGLSCLGPLERRSRSQHKANGLLDDPAKSPRTCEASRLPPRSGHDGQRCPHSTPPFCVPVPGMGIAPTLNHCWLTPPVVSCENLREQTR